MSSEDNWINPYESAEVPEEQHTDSDETPAVDYASRKRQQLIYILFAMALSGFLAGGIPDGSEWQRIVDIVSGVVVAILIVSWCNIDREERNLDRWPFFVPMMILCPGRLVMMPIYLFCSRGIGGFVATAKAFGFLILMIVIAGVTCVATLLLKGARL